MLDENCPSGAPGINGDSDVLAVERAINELRRGRAVAMTSGSACVLVLSVETASADAMDSLGVIADSRADTRADVGVNATANVATDPETRAGASLTLAVSARRAHALALTSDMPVDSGRAQSNGRAIALRLPPKVSLAAVRTLAGIDDATAVASVKDLPSALAVAAPVARAPAATTLEKVPTSNCLDAAVELSRYARLLPTVIALPIAIGQLDASVLRIDATQVERFRASRGTGLERIVSARVPLRDEEHCKLVLFRDTGADVEHLAIVIGDISGADGVAVRVHSACLTGDVLGSLRCDCGDQLRGAMRRMSERGGGVLLYLEQEGRGIGLANKLRAYSLQDGGLDTYDADGHLGFDADDRSFTEAATMLRSLGVLRIHLMTNNPHKVDALAREGIEVLSREPLTGERNPHNERYLSTKATRGGHHLHSEGV
jgi:GTP cyclohydrolase II